MLRKAIGRRRPAGRWNDRNAGLGRLARTPPRRASRSRCPGRAVPVVPRAASARGAEGSGPGRDCQSPYRDYPKAETPEARALFEAARANDEAAFTAALAGVPHPGDYADDGRPLLHRAADAAARCSKHVYWDMPKDGSAPCATSTAPRCRRARIAHAGGAAGHQAGAQRCTSRAARRCNWRCSMARRRSWTCCWRPAPIRTRPATKDASRWSSCLIAISSSRSA